MEATVPNTTPAEVLAVLLGPLRYATRDGTRGLERLRGFETLVSRVVDRAQAAGGPPEVLQRLRDRARGFDRLTPPARRTRLGLFLADLATLTPLPADLRHLILTPGTADKAETAPAPAERRGRTEDQRSERPRPIPRREEKVRGTLEMGADVGALVKLRPRIAEILKRRQIRTIRDLLFSIPRGYEDRRTLRRIAEVRVGEAATVLATVRLSGEVRGRGGRRFYRILLVDDSGTLTATWFRYPSWGCEAATPSGAAIS
jgi:hypothetical protein